MPSLDYYVHTHTHTQYFAGGAGAEADIAKHLEKITTIVRLGYNFTSPSIRTRIDGYIMRNTDLSKSLKSLYYYNIAILSVGWVPMTVMKVHNLVQATKLL